MEKRISYSDFQRVKNIAKSCDPSIRKKAALKAQIEKLAAEYKKEEQNIELLEAGIKSMIGFRVEQLVKKVIEPTGATDKAGKPIKVTKYVPTDIVTYDEQAKQYVITIPDEQDESAAEVLEPQEAPFSEGEESESSDVEELF